VQERLERRLVRYHRQGLVVHTMDAGARRPGDLWGGGVAPRRRSDADLGGTDQDSGERDWTARFPGSSDHGLLGRGADGDPHIGAGEAAGPLPVSGDGERFGICLRDLPSAKAVVAGQSLKLFLVQKAALDQGRPCNRIRCEV